MKIGNSSAAAARSGSILKFGDGENVWIGEWESNNKLSFKANNFSFVPNSTSMSMTISGNTTINGKVGIGIAPSSDYALTTSGGILASGGSVIIRKS